MYLALYEGIASGRGGGWEGVGERLSEAMFQVC